jgi:hypothetical protein
MASAVSSIRRPTTSAALQNARWKRCVSYWIRPRQAIRSLPCGPMI